MSTLDKVMSWMRFWGWTEDGGPGSVKKDADDSVIATHGDAVWIGDVEKSCEKVEHHAIIEELERRELEKQT